MIISIILAFLLRIAVVPVAHHGDLNNNISWGQLAVERGLNNFYEGKNWTYSEPNQPPLYILLYTSVAAIYELINNLFNYLNTHIQIFPSRLIWFWKDWGMEYLIKLPSILCDIGIGYLIYKFISEKKNKKVALTLAIVWLFNPLSWYNSAIWGQTDAIVNFLGLISILYLLKKDLVKFSLFFTLAFLFKPSLTIFVPVLLFVVIKEKYKVSVWLKAIIYSFLVVLASSILFHPQLNLPFWLGNLYLNRFIGGEIGDLQANAFNFWWLVNHSKVLDSTIYFGLPARTWGYLISLSFIGAALFICKNKVKEKNILILLALSALITFLFMTRIHERYLYPFFPLATILLAYADFLTIPFILLSLTYLLNLYHLFWAPGIPPLENIYSQSWFIPLLASINIGVFLYLYNFATKDFLSKKS